MDFESRSDMFFKTYAAVRMLIAIVSNVYFSFIVPASKFMIIGLIVFCVYSTARLSGFIAISLGFMAIVLTGLLLVFFSTVAQIYVLSVAMRIEFHSFGFCLAKSAVGKVLKSLPHLKFWMGSEFYYCDRLLVLTIVHIIAGQTINFLVGNPA